MKKTRIIWIALVVVLAVFLGLSMKVIDKGTEGQYTGEVAFDAGASSSGDWDAILAEITAGAQELSALDLSALGDGKAVTMKAVVTGFESKAKGKKNSITIQPEGYEGEVGLVTKYIPDIPIRDISKCKAIVVGPPPMIKFSMIELVKRGLSEDNVWISDSRRMSCGIGKCGHCRINDKYVCIDGPVFKFSEHKTLND